MDEFDKFYNKALRFLSYRPRSEKEVRSKLSTDYGLQATTIDRIINKLKEHKFIDDSEFAKLWIESRLRFKPRSLRLIKLELKQKGISEKIIEFVVHGSKLKVNDAEQAKKLVEKRIKRLKGLQKQEIYEKLGRYLASKGFDWDTIKQSVDEVLDKGV